MDMKNGYHRISFNVQEPDWDATENAWKSVVKYSGTINLQQLFSQIISKFGENPLRFIDEIRKAHHLPILESATLDYMHFFALFRFIFDFKELEQFVLNPDLSEKKMSDFFSQDIILVFHSISYMASKLLQSVDHSIYVKYSWQILMTFGKLLIPDGHRHLSSTTFNLDTIFMSPCHVEGPDLEHTAAICALENDGNIVILNEAGDSPLTQINTSDHTSMIDDKSIKFYDDSITPFFKIEFPSFEAANNAFLFSSSPPKQGFMQLAAFLHSIPNFKSTPSPPQLFNSTLDRCISNPSFEIMLYSFVMPPDESTVTADSLDVFLQRIGDRFIPFFRALIHLNWTMLPYAGHLVMRQNSQVTTLCRMFLRKYSMDYVKYMVAEMKSLCEAGAEKISAWPLNADDALVFVKDIFVPVVDVLVNSVPKMPTSMRHLLRDMFIRTAGFYVDQASPLLVMSNLLLLRFVIPPFTEDIIVSYSDREKLLKIAQTVASSLLTLFCETGWEPEKVLELSKLNNMMVDLYPKIHSFAIDLINCAECDYDPSTISHSEPSLKLFETAARRVITLDMRETNKIIHSHPYAVSLMQAIEEAIFDFSVVPTE